MVFLYNLQTRKWFHIFLKSSLIKEKQTNNAIETVCGPQSLKYVHVDFLRRFVN